MKSLFLAILFSGMSVQALSYGYMSHQAVDQTAAAGSSNVCLCGEDAGDVFFGMIDGATQKETVRKIYGPTIEKAFYACKEHLQSQIKAGVCPKK